MRASLLLLISFLIVGVFLGITLSGALLVIFGILYLIAAVIAMGYQDTAILFFLGAREVRSGDETLFFEAASQQAYKLAVPLPKLYFYNGSLERGFVLQKRDSISLVLSRSLLVHAHPSELAGICFELLLQVKKGMAPRRTRLMFILGSKSWFAHAIAGLLSKLVPLNEVRQVTGWMVNYFLYPWQNFIFTLVLGQGYFKKLRQHLGEFPLEFEKMEKVALKLRKPKEIYSVPSRKLVELSAANRSRHFQNILALELLPHEWDFLFEQQEIASAKEA